MLQSHPIQVDGTFVGAAIPADGAYRFVAVDIRMEPLDQSTWPSLADVQRVVQHLYRTGRFPERAPTSDLQARHPRLVLVPSSRTAPKARPFAGG